VRPIFGPEILSIRVQTLSFSLKFLMINFLAIIPLSIRYKECAAVDTEDSIEFNIISNRFKNIKTGIYAIVIALSLDLIIIINRMLIKMIDQ
jgi:hypothetical protein